MRCPECDGALTIAEGIRPSEIVQCGECKSELEVLTVDPVVLAVAPDIEEDWGE